MDTLKKILHERVIKSWKSTLAAAIILYIGYLHHVGKIELGPVNLEDIGPVVTALILLLQKDWDK